MKILPIVKTDINMFPLAERCKVSWDYFHPDIPMHLVKLEDWIGYMEEVKQFPKYGEASMFVGLFYAIQKMMVEGYELIIHLDADTVVTGRCNEILVGDYDVAVSNSPTDNFYNAGVWATTNINFIKDFYYPHIVCPITDNYLFVEIVKYYRQQHKIKVLDDDKSEVWYNERSRQWWNRLTVKNDELFTPDRQIKILHWAGGFGQPLNDRMSCSLFSDEVKQWLNKITSGTTFTDYDGEAFGKFIKDYYGLQ